MEPKKCYSTNGEEFNYEDIEDAIRDAFDDPSIEVGMVTTISEGDAIPRKAGDFADFWPTDRLSETAYDECGESADEWPNCTDEQVAELNQRLRDVVNQWADKHGLHPNFYRVANVKEIKVELVDPEGGYKILETAEEAP